MLWAWAIIDRQAGNPVHCDDCKDRGRKIRARVVLIEGNGRTQFKCLTHASQSRHFNRRVRELAEMRKEHRRRGDQC